MEAAVGRGRTRGQGPGPRPGPRPWLRARGIEATHRAQVGACHRPRDVCGPRGALLHSRHNRQLLEVAANTGEEGDGVQARRRRSEGDAPTWGGGVVGTPVTVPASRWALNGTAPPERGAPPRASGARPGRQGYRAAALPRGALNLPRQLSAASTAELSWSSSPTHTQRSIRQLRRRCR
eukprot:scaffold7471_cov49-Phaeocystis_antarctica.AAC.2